MTDDAKPGVGEKKCLAFPAVRAERPAVTQRHDRTVRRSPVFVVQNDGIARSESRHVWCPSAWWRAATSVVWYQPKLDFPCDLSILISPLDMSTPKIAV